MYGDIPGRGSTDELRIKNIERIGLRFKGKNGGLCKTSRNFLKGCLQIIEEDRWDWEDVRTILFKIKYVEIQSNIIKFNQLNIIK